MSSNEEKYKTYVTNVRRMLAISGLWPKTKPTIGLTVAVVGLFTQVIMAMGVLNFCVRHITNIGILTKGMSIVLSFCNAGLKLFIFLLYREDLKKLDSELTHTYEEDMKAEKNHPSLFKNVSIYSRFYYVQIVSAISSIALYAIIPMIALAKYGIYRRMFPIIYPFSFKPGGLIHWSLYLCELLTGYYLFAVSVGVDCGFGMYSLQMCGELRVLANEFENLKGGIGCKEKVKKCVKKHYMILDSKNRLERLYGLLTIWMAVTSAVVLCSLIFQFAESLKSKSFSVGIALVSFYMEVKFLQVFSYAWYGNTISDESEVCQDAIYKSNWPDCDDVSLRKSILIIMTQKPMVLTAKGCMQIQLNMFVTIAKTSVSYFCLLQTLNEES